MRHGTWRWESIFRQMAPDVILRGSVLAQFQGRVFAWCVCTTEVWSLMRVRPPVAAARERLPSASVGRVRDMTCELPCPVSKGSCASRRHPHDCLSSACLAMVCGT